MKQLGVNTVENAGRAQGGRYQPLNALRNVSAAPQGFEVHFATDERAAC